MWDYLLEYDMGLVKLLGHYSQCHAMGSCGILVKAPIQPHLMGTFAKREMKRNLDIFQEINGRERNIGGLKLRRF